MDIAALFESTPENFLQTLEEVKQPLPPNVLNTLVQKYQYYPDIAFKLLDFKSELSQLSINYIFSTYASHGYLNIISKMLVDFKDKLPPYIMVNSYKEAKSNGHLNIASNILKEMSDEAIVYGCANSDPDDSSIADLRNKLSNPIINNAFLEAASKGNLYIISSILESENFKNALSQKTIEEGAQQAASKYYLKPLSTILEANNNHSCNKINFLKQESSEIPKEIHYVWISKPGIKNTEPFNEAGSDFSEYTTKDKIICGYDYQSHILENINLYSFVKRTAELYHDDPTWKITFWTNDENKIPHAVKSIQTLNISVRNLSEIERLSNLEKLVGTTDFGKLIDYVKYNILYQEGGFMMDIDTWNVAKIPDCLRKFGHFNTYNENFFFGFSPQHYLLEKMISIFTDNVSTNIWYNRYITEYQKYAALYINDFWNADSTTCNFVPPFLEVHNFGRNIKAINKESYDINSDNDFCIAIDFHANSWNNIGENPDSSNDKTEL